jgi:hypothetical protein
MKVTWGLQSWTLGDGLSKEVWVGQEWKPKHWLRLSVFFITKSIIDKILAVRLEGLFWAGNKVRCSFGFGLWAWPLEASHCVRPSWGGVGVRGQGFGLWTWPLEASHYARHKAPLIVFYWLCIFSLLFGLSTRFGHSIPQPLNLDGHSVKRHLGSLHTQANSRDHEIVRAQKKVSQGRPKTPPTSCSVVTDPQV